MLTPDARISRDRIEKVAQSIPEITQLLAEVHGYMDVISEKALGALFDPELAANAWGATMKGLRYNASQIPVGAMYSFADFQQVFRDVLTAGPVGFSNWLNDVGGGRTKLA